MDTTKIDMFKKVLEIDPVDPAMHFGLGLEYMTAGMYAEAEPCFRKAIEFKDDYSAAYRELGKALTALGRDQEAVPVYEKGIPIAENNGDIQTGKEMQVFLNRITCGE
ncbi:MAG: tetratricopeptide repeat protein [Gemmatimonadota bacterium]|nr:tetratricopeptide repeat protein [Gemmatimonadota bacterium]